MVVPFDWGSVTFWGATIPVAELIAAILFIAATITDNLDGRIARRDHLVTNFGKFADPLADKLLVMTAFIVLTGQGVVPSWVTAIIIWRELSVTGLRLLLVEQNGTVLAAKIMLYICLFFTVYSGIDYFVKGRGVFADGFK